MSVRILGSMGMAKRLDFISNKKRFSTAAKNSRYRHKKRAIKMLEALGLSSEDYDNSESAETIDFPKLYCRARGLCEWCGIELSFNEAGQDHLIPFAKGGSNKADNIVLCCKDCNSRKATKHRGRFAAEQKARGITTPLIVVLLEEYKNDPSIQKILGLAST